MAKVYRLKSRYGGRSAHYIVKGELRTLCGAWRHVDLQGIRHAGWDHETNEPKAAYPRTIEESTSLTLDCQRCTVIARRRKLI